MLDAINIILPFEDTDYLTVNEGGKIGLSLYEQSSRLLKMDGTFAFPLQTNTNFNYSQANGTWTLNRREENHDTRRVNRFKRFKRFAIKYKR